MEKFKQWLPIGQWATLMATTITCFAFVHAENSHLTQRLDNHITQINNRCDELSKRSDDLHREFYELLKEMRDKK
jgi:chaperonin cofactor prefoldin